MSDLEPQANESQVTESLSKLDVSATARVLARFTSAGSSNSSDTSANATATVQPRSLSESLGICRGILNFLLSIMKWTMLHGECLSNSI